LENSNKHIKWLWILLVSPVFIIILFIFLVGFGVFGSLPKVDELLNPKNNLATIVYSGDMKIL